MIYVTRKKFRVFCAEAHSMEGDCFRLSRLTWFHRLNAVIEPTTGLAFIELEDGLASVPIILSHCGERATAWVDYSGDGVRTDHKDVRADLFRALDALGDQLNALVTYWSQLHSADHSPIRHRQRKRDG